MNPNIEQYLGPCSPMGSKDNGPARSVSFQHDLQENAASGFTAQSRPARLPFGERVSGAARGGAV
jgi:hypothetical protein